MSRIKNPNASCASCPFFNQLEQGVGVCVYNPPVITMAASPFPMVGHDFLCGKHPDYFLTEETLEQGPVYMGSKGRDQ